MKSPEEMALEAAESLWEPEWKKNMVDANAVLLMAGTFSLTIFIIPWNNS